MNSKRKYFTILVVIAIVILLGVLVFFQRTATAYGEDFYSSDASNDEKIVKLWVGSQKMQDTMGEDNLYPYFYKQVKTAEIAGTKNTEALSDTESDIMEKEALYRYAQNHKGAVSEKELDSYVDKELKTIKTSDDYDKLNKLYQGEGTSFDNEYKANVRWNRYNATLSKWRSSVEAEKADSLENEIVEKYSSSSEGKTLREKLDKCEQAYETYGSNAEKVLEEYEDELDLPL